MNSLNAKNIYINLVGVEDLILDEDISIKNSLREYLRTINKSGNIRYIIVNYEYNGESYYASLRIWGEDIYEK